MGIFRDIVRRSRRSEKRFSLGYTFQDGEDDVDCLVKFVEKEGQLEPAVESVKVGFFDGEVVFQSNESIDAPLMLASENASLNSFLVDVRPVVLNNNDPFFLLNFIASSRMESSPTEKNSLDLFVERKFEESKGLLGRRFGSAYTVFSTSPVRSRPKRTYDPTREYDDPEGSDIPMRLMRYEATKSNDWEVLKRRLEEFGESSGLFQRIDVNNLGRSMGAPFQLKVKVRGPNSNIVDVGYGVSQVLPILVHILNLPFGSLRAGRLSELAFSLLQQPEVHLHPKAQAELSSLLAQLARVGNQSFIVETHSDYMVDRARIEIMKGNISARTMYLSSSWNQRKTPSKFTISPLTKWET